MENLVLLLSGSISHMVYLGFGIIIVEFCSLYYANVSVGTPSVWFIVALSQGSDLFWLPCDCTSCLHGVQLESERVNFNIYSPSRSSTAQNVTCKSPKCSRKSECHSAESACPYEVKYRSNGTSSGFLVEDTLHLTTDTTTRREPVNVPITFGCGQVLTGAILEGGAPNGLLGLGMSNESVPTTLAREGYISDSFSMCFGPDGIGRISFGDTGSSDQKETPLNPHLSDYNISITSVQVAGNSVELEFHAIFHSGTSMTMLNDPAYTLITQAFDKQAKGKRSTSSAGLPFEYCYETWSYQNVNLVMKGGSIFKVTEPISVEVSLGNARVYCLGVMKSKGDNIIGQNFMTGYRIVFNRERNVLGWKESNCFDDELLNSATNLLLPLHAITLLFLALFNIFFYFNNIIVF